MKITDDPVLKEQYNMIMREYQRKRYNEDPKFRENKIKANMEWQKRNPEKVKVYRKRAYLKRRGKVENANNL